MARYNVVLKTGSADGAGTDADVAIELRGQFGNSGWIILDYASNNDRERGNEDVYGFNLNTGLGDIREIAFRLRDANGNRPDWNLNYVSIVDFNVPNNVVWEFPFNAWIYIDGKKEWFNGPVLSQRQFKGAAPFAVYVGDGGTALSGIGTSSSALNAGFKTDGVRTLCAVSRSSDKLDVFSTESGGGIFTAAWEPSFGAQWKGWWQIGTLKSVVRGATAVASRSKDKLDVFCVGTDGRVYTAAWDAAGKAQWQGWTKIGDLQTLAGAPISVVSRSADKLDVFCTDSNGRVCTAAWTPTTGWKGWWPVANGQTAPGALIGAVSRSVDKLDVFCVGTDGYVYAAAWEPSFGAQWHGWTKIGNLQALTGTPVSVVSRSADKLDVFCTDHNGRVHTAAWTPTTGWQGWWPVANGQTAPGALIGAVSRAKDKLDIFCVGTDSFIYTASWDTAGKAQWQGWTKIGTLRIAPGSQLTAVSRSTDKLDIFCVGPDGRVYTAAWEPASKDWKGWWPVGNLKVYSGNS